MRTVKQDDQRQKIIIVIVLAVALVGYIAYTIFSAGSGAAQTVKTSGSDQSQKSLGPISATPVADAASIPNSVFPGITTPTPRRDPFSIQGTYMGVNQMPQANTAKTQPVPSMPNINSNPLKAVNPFKMMGKLLPAPTTPTIVAAGPAARPKLTGVIIGPETVAIMTYGNKNYVVEQGHTFAGRYRLVSVMKESVMLQDGSKQIRIGLGG